MKKFIFIIASVICIISATVTFHKAIPTNLKIGALLENFDALADFDEDGEMVKKNCYTVFTSRTGPDLYYTCSNTSSDPNKMYPCGAVSDKKPAGMSQIHDCYSPSYE